jgi:hypothetical protein
MNPARALREFGLRVIVPFQWLFVRLSKPFSLPLVIIALVYFFLVFPALVNWLIPKLISFPLSAAHNHLETILSGHSGFWYKAASIFLAIVFLDIILIASALMTLAVAIAGILLSHLLAGQFYLHYRRFRAKPIEPPVPVGPLRSAASETRAPDPTNPLAMYKRIGIILSGGGAKGAYQPGAMKAIHDFLEEHNAHDKVR